MVELSASSSLNKEAYDRNFYDAQSAASLRSAQVVLGRVFPLLLPSRVLDVGCGTGPWLRAALDLGASEVWGIDGDYVDRSMLMVEADRFIPADLVTTKVDEALSKVPGKQAEKRFDLVMCLETAEHLPFGRAPSLIRELTALTDVVLFSAAVPYQYGTQHINEQWPEFWSILFRAEGFSCYDPLRAELWGRPDVDWWYAQNTLLFAREGSQAATQIPSGSRTYGRGLSLVHPESLLSNLLGLPRRYRLNAAHEEVVDFRSLLAANQQSGVELPHLTAPARARSSGGDEVGLFPATRMVTWHPEREVAELSTQLLEAGRHLEAANAANEAERFKRDELEAALSELRPENEALRHEVERLRNAEKRVQEQGVARRLAEVNLVDFQNRETDRRRSFEQALEADRALLRAEAMDVQAAAAAHKAELALQRAHLDAHAAALDHRRAGLDAYAAATHLLRRSRTWRLTRRILQLTGRLPAVVDDTLPPLVVPKMPELIHPPALPVSTAAAALALPEALLDEAAAEALPKHAIKRYAEVLGQVDWWTLAAAITRLKRLDVFDVDDYIRRNPDVIAAGLDPYAHFIQSGALEGRGRIDLEDLARLFGSLNLFDNAARALPKPKTTSPNVQALAAEIGPIGLFVSSHGNVFMNDIAEDLAVDLRGAGVDVELLDETVAVDSRPEVSIYIAPHEFFTLGEGTKWVRDDVLSQGFVFGTEQLQTNWFNTALPFMLMARGMLDLCVQTVEVFKRLDMASMHVLPGARQRPHALTERDRRHPLFGVLPAAARPHIVPATPFKERPIDISFFGTSSPRRDAFFSRNAAFLADYETFNYCRRPGRGPIRAESEDGTLSRMAGHVCGHSKIALNIHREEFGYFEWHRMVRLGMYAGSLVVSDPCLPHPDFVANEHYLQEDLRHIPNLLEWLLKTDDGAREAERVRANVDRLLTGTYDVDRTVPMLLSFLSQHRFKKKG